MIKSKHTQHKNRLLLYALMYCTAITLCVSAEAALYKWVDKDGVTHYSNIPPVDQPTQEVKGTISSYQAPELGELPEDFLRKNVPGKKVVMYSAIWCGVCKRAKAYFSAKKIPYQEYDIETSAKGKNDYQKLNGRGVPIILVGKHRLNGFSTTHFEKLY